MKEEHLECFLLFLVVGSASGTKTKKDYALKENMISLSYEVVLNFCPSGWLCGGKGTVYSCTGEYRSISSTSGSVITSQWVKIEQALSSPEINSPLFSFDLVSSSLFILKFSIMSK